MRRALMCLFALAALVVPDRLDAATPPAQPSRGPGGSDYAASQVTKRAVGIASAPVYVFHAAGAAAEPRPIVVFLHAWGSNNPQVYGGWIDHLARRGNLVLFPRYQEISRTRPADATRLAAELVKEALDTLGGDPEARPDRERVAFVGHLAGAAVAANLAAVAAAEGLPKPDLVFAVMPGGIARNAKARGIPLADLAQIDPSTLIITMIGDREHLPSDRAAKRILKEANRVPAERKLFMRARSDDHGFPTITATLASPGSPKDEYDAAKIQVPPDPPRDPRALRAVRQKWSADMALTGEQIVIANQLAANVIDTIDYLAFWKTLDMAMAAAFAGRDAQALRADETFIDMGRWSDGWPVRRLGASDPPT